MPYVDDLHGYSAVDLAAAIRSKRLSPVEVFDAFVARIERLNPSVNAFVTLDLAGARDIAKEIERRLAAGDDPGILAGLPIGIKDLTATAGLRTTYGSELYRDFVPAEDDAVVRRIRDAGGAIAGKTTTPEFGSHVVTQSSVFGITRNPWALDRTPGGSSGGSAAAVACGMLPLAQGNDGGGSIRIPAAFCGVFGFKPSYGRISNAPSTDFYSTIAHNGPIARTVADGLLLFRAMAGYDARDPYSLPDDDFSRVLDDLDLTGLRVAWSPDLGYAQVEPDILAMTAAAAGSFAELGADVEEAHPEPGDPRPFFNRIIALHMGATVVDKAPERRGDLSATMEALLQEMEGTSAWDFARALRQRSEYHRSMTAFFDRFDLLLTPTMGAHPPSADAPLGPNLKIEGMYFTHPFNLTHLPASTVPAGWTADGIPVGLQIVGRPRADALVLRASAAFEACRPWADRWPDM